MKKLLAATTALAFIGATSVAHAASTADQAILDAFPGLSSGLNLDFSDSDFSSVLTASGSVSTGDLIVGDIVFGTINLGDVTISGSTLPKASFATGGVEQLTGVYALRIDSISSTTIDLKPLTAAEITTAGLGTDLKIGDTGFGDGSTVAAFFADPVLNFSPSATFPDLDKADAVDGTFWSSFGFVDSSSKWTLTDTGGGEIFNATSAFLASDTLAIADVDFSIEQILKTGTTVTFHGPLTPGSSKANTLFGGSGVHAIGSELAFSGFATPTPTAGFTAMAAMGVLAGSNLLRRKQHA